MNNSWPLPTGPTTFNYSSSDLPAPPYKRPETPIPKGTVASRIAHLQKLAGPSSPSRPSPPSAHGEFR